jgi:hypothetical protein
MSATPAAEFTAALIGTPASDRSFRRFAGAAAVGKLTIALGAACLLDGLANVVGAKPVADLGLYAYLLLAPAWAVWVGVRILRDRAA